MVEALRTPDERFEGLSGFNYEPRYVEVDDTEGGALRIHYVDEGSSQGQPVLMLHGEPTWAYLYRKMIPVFAAAGFRAIAPDLAGFGRSDKPSKRTDYTYQRHLDWMRSVVDQLGLERIILFGQDWGGLIGLRLATEEPDRFSHIVASNTFLPTGDLPMSKGFEKWKEFSQRIETFDVGRIVNNGCVSELDEATIAAYDAPFPDESFKEGPRQFPMIVPVTPDDPQSEPNRRAWDVLQKWDKPFLTLFGDSDPVTRGADAFFQSAVPGAGGQPHRTIEGAGHFIQEDKGEELAQAIVDWLAQ